jgi:hypothetical protein
MDLDQDIWQIIFELVVFYEIIIGGGRCKFWIMLNIPDLMLREFHKNPNNIK